MTELLSTEEAAKRLRRSLRTLCNWRVSGFGPQFVKLGKRGVFYRPEDLEAFIAENARQSTTEAA
jgi:helix-turn-helix protein